MKKISLLIALFSIITFGQWNPLRNSEAQYSGAFSKKYGWHASSDTVAQNVWLTQSQFDALASSIAAAMVSGGPYNVEIGSTGYVTMMNISALSDSIAKKLVRDSIKVRFTNPQPIVQAHSVWRSTNDTLGQAAGDSISICYFGSNYLYGKIVLTTSAATADSAVIENYDTISGSWYSLGARLTNTDAVSQYIIPGVATTTYIYVLNIPVPGTIRVRRLNTRWTNYANFTNLTYVRFVGNN